MSRLLSLKPWLSLAEAADYLQGIFNEQVAVADVLRFCISGNLTLSANFVNHGRAKLARKVPIREAGFTVMPALLQSDSPPTVTLSCSERAVPEFQAWLEANPDMAAMVRERKESLFLCMRGDEISETECITRGEDGIQTIEGLWDLTMVGAERLDVEHALQQETSGPSVELICLDGVLLSRADGTYARLQEEFDKEEKSRKPIDWKAPREERLREEESRYFPAGRLPPDVPLVVRPESLLRFVALASGSPQGDMRPLVEPAEAARPTKLRSDREQNLLRVIAGLWALSGLPGEHYTTADKLSCLFDCWGWEKPDKDSIADGILKPAATLPGAAIRTSG